MGFLGVSGGQRSVHVHAHSPRYGGWGEGRAHICIINMQCMHVQQVQVQIPSQILITSGQGACSKE